MQPCPKVLTKAEWITRRLEEFPNERYDDAERLYNTIHQMIHSPQAQAELQRMIRERDF